MVYPNPAVDYFNLFLIPTYNSNMSAVLYDAQGRAVKEVSNIQTGVNYRFETTNLSPGIYFLSVENGTAKSVSRISVQH